MKTIALFSTLTIALLGVSLSAQAKCTPLDPPEYQDCGAPSGTQAVVSYSKIICTYKNHPNQQVETTFETPAGTNFFSKYEGEVPVKINGSSEPAIFQAQFAPLYVSDLITLTHRGDFFVNDITLEIEKNRIGGGLRVSGTWVVDHPPVLELDCKFAK